MTKPNPETLAKLRARIAELCGWKNQVRRSYRETPAWFAPNGISMYDDPPDYPEDLNAVHDAEKLLLSTDDDILQFMESLTDVCGGDTPAGTASFTAYFAEAWQRCIALDRTLSESPIV